MQPDRGEDGREQKSAGPARLSGSKTWRSFIARRACAGAAPMAECGAVTSPLDPNAAARESGACPRRAETARRASRAAAAPVRGRCRASIGNLVRGRHGGGALACLHGAARHWRRGEFLSNAARLASHRAQDWGEALRAARASSRASRMARSGRGEASDDDLILTRILTLDGLEDGVNRGPGCDSLERYIYIHGTNQEPCSAGPEPWLRAHVQSGRCAPCSTRIEEGDYVFIAPPAPSAIPDPFARGPLSLCRSRRIGHERARAIPSDERRQGQRQRPRLRPWRTDGASAAARSSRHRSAAARRQRHRAGLRGAGGVDRSRRASSRCCRGARQQYPDHSPLRAARAFRRDQPHHRGERHQRQIDGDGDDLRDPARLRPRSLGDHRRRSSPVAGARPGRQCLCGRAPICWSSRPTRATARWCAMRRRSA